MPEYHSRVGVTSRLRMRGHNYAAPASYLITICTERRLCLFGNVVGGERIPSPAGIVIDSWWHFLPARYASVELDAAIVMPNHFHAIVHLGTDPDVEAIPSLGSIVRWFKKRGVRLHRRGENRRMASIPGATVAGAVLRSHHPG